MDVVVLERVTACSGKAGAPQALVVVEQDDAPAARIARRSLVARRAGRDAQREQSVRETVQVEVCERDGRRAGACDGRRLCNLPATREPPLALEECQVRAMRAQRVGWHWERAAVGEGGSDLRVVGGGAEHTVPGVQARALALAAGVVRGEEEHVHLPVRVEI
eukprot:scaffold84178_cov30-Tisochrysis_lutea.AAC.3